MKILSLLSALVIFFGSFLALSNLARAQNLFVPEVLGLPMIGIGVLQVFITLFLFLFIPVAFIGMILRSFGFKKEGEGQGWRWNLKQALFRFLKYLLYHGAMFYVWLIIILPSLKESRYMSPRKSMKLLIDDYWLLFLIYAVAWAFIGPYIIYFWHKLLGKPTFKPSFWSHARLVFWNIFIFLVAGLIVSMFFDPRELVL